MGIFSYLDTTLRIIHLNIDLKDDSDEMKRYADVLENQVDRNQKFKKELIQNFTRNQVNSKPELQFLVEHESHHYWQTIFYPFLYYLSWLEFKSIIGAYSNVHDGVNLNGEPFKFGVTQLNGKLLMNLNYNSFKFKIKSDGKKFHLEYELTDNDLSDENIFTLNDIIEDSTTLFQYKCSQNKQEPNSFISWIKNPRNKGYKRLIRFLNREINAEFVFKVLLPAAQLSFYTTEPISSFVNILNYSNFNALEVFEPNEIFAKIKEFLIKNYSKTKVDLTKEISILDTPVCYISVSMYEEMINYSNQGPFPFPIQIKKYSKLVRDIQSGVSLRKLMKIHEVSKGTVIKVKKLL